MKKCVVVINPKSGNSKIIKEKEKIEKIIEKYNYDVNIIFTKYRGHATKIVKELDDSIDLVISVGGDGTFFEIMNGNINRKKKLVLAHLSSGTANDIGHMFGLGNNFYVNLKLILEGTIKNIDICLINNKAFVYVASYGKFMDIPYKTPQELKKRLGYMAYMLEIIKKIFNRIPKHEINFWINGEKHTGKYTFIIISNANRIAGINNFYNDVKLDDNKFEVMFCSLNKKIDILKAFYTLKTSGVKYVAGVESYKVSELEIEFLDSKDAWCLDGEEYISKDYKYKLRLVNDIKMLIPNKNIEKLFLNK